jgi:hypothetical protein
MNRCARTLRAAVLAAAPLLAPLAAPLPASAQEAVMRNFPATALRGQIAFGIAPEIVVNGKIPARLSPGARIRGTNNLLVMSAALTGQTWRVNYTIDPLGQVHDVWILRPDELARPWPTTPSEAAALVFDPAAQAWSRPQR